MRYPDYVWMIHNWYNLDWWRRNNSDCTDSQLRNMLDMQLIIDHYPRLNEVDRNKINDAGIVS